jgi:hypothetical protein
MTALILVFLQILYTLIAVNFQPLCLSPMLPILAYYLKSDLTS